jgi:AraC family transcriptional regulator
MHASMCITEVRRSGPLKVSSGQTNHLELQSALKKISRNVTVGRMQVNPDQVTRGSVLRMVQIGDFTLTRSRHEPRAILPPHTHEHASLVYVLQGHFRETFGGRTMDCGPGRLLYKPPDHVHTNAYGGEPVFCLTVGLLPAGYSQLKAAHASVSAPWDGEPATPRLPAWRVVRELADPGPDSAAILESLTLELLGARLEGTSRAGTAVPGWLSAVRDYLHQQLDGHISLRDAAALARVHPIHFAREFRRHFHTSLGEHSRRLRIGEAARRLRCESTPLTQIAHDLGFADQSHFGRIFRRYTGFSPARFRGRPE